MYVYYVDSYNAHTYICVYKRIVKDYLPFEDFYICKKLDKIHLL